MSDDKFKWLIKWSLIWLVVIVAILIGVAFLGASPLEVWHWLLERTHEAIKAVKG